MKKFGIIAGAGSIAGVYAYKAIIEYFSTSGVLKDADFPYLKIINYPFKSMDNTGVQSKAILNSEIQTFMQDVEDCDYIFILCNSIHSFITESMTSEQKNKLISLPSLIQNKSEYDTNKKTLVISSQTSKEEKLFNFLGDNISYLDEEMQSYMNKFVQETIEGKTNTTFQRYLSQFIELNNFEQIILGCTDLYIQAESFVFEDCTTINPLNYLAKFIYEENQKSNLNKTKEKQDFITFMEKIFPSYLFSYDKELG